MDCGTKEKEEIRKVKNDKSGLQKEKGVKSQVSTLMGNHLACRGK